MLCAVCVLPQGSSVLCACAVLCCVVLCGLKTSVRGKDDDSDLISKGLRLSEFSKCMFLQGFPYRELTIRTGNAVLNFRLRSIRSKPKIQ